MFDDAKPVCPHCGADSDLTYVDDSYDPDLGEFDSGPDYEETLRREGLAPAPPQSRRRPRGVFWMVVLVVAAVGAALAVLATSMR
jgi:hypothetical protein